MKKVLIIKLGYSETLDSLLSLTISLGDVLRTTVILHFLQGNHISWLVDAKASPLLQNNKYIDRILLYNSNTINGLKKEKFDVIINLEKMPQLCEFSDSLVARKRFGFNSENINGGNNSGLEAAKRLTELTQDLNKKRENEDCWQKILADILGKEWHGQEYILGYKPKSEIKFDVGFNWTTGSKWTNKAWPRGHWDKLESLIKGKYSVSWQAGMDSINEYIDWINSCRLIVTADTLGLHVGLALKKRIVALFGPSSSREIYFYGQGSFLLPRSPYKCIPCLKTRCDKKKQCMEYIAPEIVKERIEDEFKKNNLACRI